MTDDSEELRAALLMITHKANEANIHRDEDDVLETIIEIARAALAAAPQPMGCGYPCGFDCNGACFDWAAAPQPALKDREALMEVIQQALWCCPDTGQMPDDAIADALLARGLRLSGGDETMAWAVVGEDGAVELVYVDLDRGGLAKMIANSLGKKAARVAIRVVEGADDAA